MSQSPDEIRRDIDELRVALRQNLDRLEERVRLPTPALPSPLALFGGSVLVGFLLGLRGGGRGLASPMQPDAGASWPHTALIALIVVVLYDVARTVYARWRQGKAPAPTDAL